MKPFRPLLAAALVTLALPLAAAEEQSPEAEPPKSGEAVEIHGAVYHHIGDSVRPVRLREPGAVVRVGDRVRTKRESSALFALVDDSKVYLDPQSVIHFKGVKDIVADEGSVIFDIRRQGGAQGLQVRTKTAIIGVKGTRFLVESDGGKENVYLKSGKLSVKSLQGQFKLFEQDQRSEFERFQQQQEGAFTDYRERLQKEFARFVAEFEMEAGSSISIDGSEVRRGGIPDEVEAKFAALEQALAGEDAEAPSESVPDAPEAEPEADEAPAATSSSS